LFVQDLVTNIRQERKFFINLGWSCMVLGS
jgi:hypothetical protein